jgi:hypothetical protein
MKNMKGNNKKNVYMQAAVALLLLCSAGVSAVHQPRTLNPSASTVVQSTFLPGDVPAIILTVIPGQVQYSQSLLNGQSFANVELNGEGFTTDLGSARLPTISRFLEIPQGAQPQLRVESVTWQTTSLASAGLPLQILPVQPSLVKTPDASVEFTFDAASYAVDAFSPSMVAQVSVLGEIRAYQTAMVEIFPIQYNPVTGELHIMTQCTLGIDLPGSDLIQTAAQIDRYSAADFSQLYHTMFVNDGALQGTGRMSPGQEGYLFIVGDELYDAIQPLADWKTSKGFEVTVIKTSEIPGGVTKEHIKTYIKDAYNNWTIPPTYVLLVGDVAQIPTWTGTETGTCTDLYYVTIDSGNYFADVIISRFSGSTSEQITNMVDKTIYYEQGVFPDDSWIKKAVFMASNDNYQVSEGTHNYVIDTYMTPHNFTCDKLYCHTYGATTSQVTAALNDGRSLAIYSGHGSTDSWADGPPYSQSNVNSLTNDGMYPFVCSHACLTNQFTVSECFGETWIRAPHKGGLAFWGATDYSYWDEDDILERSTFKAWFDDGIETIGGMTNMGLYYLYQHYSGGGLTLYYFEEYNVLGDSSVKLWGGQPAQNTAPNTPAQPTGPTTGEIGIEYTFTTSTTDPQNDPVYYMVSWGDTVSDWLGPYTSGATASLVHTWTMIGDYSISVKAKDTEGLESDWSPAAIIHILALPRIEIGNITGGFGVTVPIKNVGAGDASAVNWSITLDGGLILLGRQTTGSFAKIMPGFAPKAKSGFVIGIGTVTIVVSATDVQKTATARVIGPFVLNVQ